MNDKLEALIQQRKELDKQIKIIQEGATVCGKTKLMLRKFPRGNEWSVVIEKKTEYARENRWYSVIQLEDKKAVLAEIYRLIADLGELAANIEQEGEESYGNGNTDKYAG